MLAPSDHPANGSTPGSSREALMQSQSISRPPQGPVTAASPQHMGGTITSHVGADSPYSTPTTMSRSPHVQLSDFSPSVSNPQAYSPTLVSPTLAPSYLPPPSPTPSERGVYPVSKGYYDNRAGMYSTTTDGTSQQYMYQQDPYQHQQQTYPEPVVQAYPDPALVGTPIITEKPKPALVSSKKPKSTGRRKKIIWAMALITVILLGVVIYLVVSMKKNKGSNNDSPSSDGRVQAPPIPPYPGDKGHCPSFFCHNYFFDTCEGECKKDSVYQACKDDCKG
ncbi:hypothetical protein BGZ47_002054, partial [Haplosporangium gracile]